MSLGLSWSCVCWIGPDDYRFCTCKVMYVIILWLQAGGECKNMRLVHLKTSTTDIFDTFESIHYSSANFRNSKIFWVSNKKQEPSSKCCTNGNSTVCLGYYHHSMEDCKSGRWFFLQNDQFLNELASYVVWYLNQLTAFLFHSMKMKMLKFQVQLGFSYPMLLLGNSTGHIRIVQTLEIYCWLYRPSFFFITHP